MTKYRKKPVIVEAWLWDGRPETIYQIGNSGIFSVGRPRRNTNSMVHDWELKFDAWGGGQLQLIITTLEGTMTANKGDYIIKGIEGEYYPCKPDIFKETYEAVDDEKETSDFKRDAERVKERTKL